MEDWAIKVNAFIYIVVKRNLEDLYILKWFKIIEKITENIYSMISFLLFSCRKLEV